LPRPEKVQFVEDLAAQMSQNEISILVNFTGLTVGAINNLRRQLEAPGGISMQVVKNTLARLACQKVGQEAMIDKLVGPNALILGEDPVTPAKILMDFAKTNPKLEIKGAVLKGRWLDSDRVTALSKLPGLQEMRAQVAGVLAAPMRNLASALAAVPRGLATALSALKDQKEKQAA